jgi:hypothetical protein
MIGIAGARIMQYYIASEISMVGCNYVATSQGSMNIMNRRVYRLKGGMRQTERHILFTEEPTVLAVQEHPRDRREAQPDLRECPDMITAHLIAQHTIWEDRRRRGPHLEHGHGRFAFAFAFMGVGSRGFRAFRMFSVVEKEGYGKESTSTAYDVR